MSCAKIVTAFSGVTQAWLTNALGMETSFIDLTMYIQYVQEMINKKSKQS